MEEKGYVQAEMAGKVGAGTGLDAGVGYAADDAAQEFVLYTAAVVMDQAESMVRIWEMSFARAEG